MMKESFSVVFSKVYQKMLFMVVFGYCFILLSSVMKSVYFMEFMLWDLGGMGLSINLLVDSIGVMFIGTIMIISGSVLMYCYWYMDDEKYFFRFMYLVYLFVGSMMFMILIPNLITLLIGWDGLGLTSFLLVAHYQNSSSLSGSLLTALTNRIGDGLILLSISLWGSVENMWVLYNFSGSFMSVFFICALIFGGMTKSAQMPFCAWLPAAMAAPTPVSSLVHSSTLVTAGVYLLIRAYPVMSKSGEMMLVLKLLSLFTLVLASSAAIFCFDMKKIIALSTLSQLSVMMFSLSHGLVYVSFFHLVMHALFKALLFLSAGVVIHSMKSCQDIRSMGNCWANMPFSMVSMFIASCSLSGLPFMSGFFSKDMIVDLVYNSKINFFCFFVMMPGLGLTSIYSMRMVWMVSFGENKVMLGCLSVKEPMKLLIPYLSLGFGALFLGKMMCPITESLIYYSSSSLGEMLVLSILFSLGVVYLSVANWGKGPSYDHKKCSSFLFSMWYLELVTHVIKKMFFDLSKSIYEVCDKGMLETVGPKGVYWMSMKMSCYNENLQSNFFLKSIFFFFIVFSGMIFMMSIVI
nr:NADH dehydrogenase subunit 5 [Perna viridis]